MNLKPRATVKADERPLKAWGTEVGVVDRGRPIPPVMEVLAKTFSKKFTASRMPRRKSLPGVSPSVLILSVTNCVWTPSGTPGLDGTTIMTMYCASNVSLMRGSAQEPSRLLVATLKVDEKPGSR